MILLKLVAGRGDVRHQRIENLAIEIRVEERIPLGLVLKFCTYTVFFIWLDTSCFFTKVPVFNVNVVIMWPCSSKNIGRKPIVTLSIDLKNYHLYPVWEIMSNLCRRPRKYSTVCVLVINLWSWFFIHNHFFLCHIGLALPRDSLHSSSGTSLNSKNTFENSNTTDASTLPGEGCEKPVEQPEYPNNGISYRGSASLTCLGTIEMRKVKRDVWVSRSVGIGLTIPGSNYSVFCQSSLPETINSSSVSHRLTFRTVENKLLLDSTDQLL